MRFICRIYDADIHEVTAFVQDFAELGDFFYEPIRNYSSGMGARLSFSLSMAIDFDVVLIDEKGQQQRFHNVFDIKAPRFSKPEISAEKYKDLLQQQLQKNRSLQ